MLYLYMIKTAEKPDVFSPDLENKNAVLKTENRHLKEQLDWLRRQVFGQKSERFIDSIPKEELLSGLNLSAEAEKALSEIIVPPHKRKKRKMVKTSLKLISLMTYPEKKK